MSGSDDDDDVPTLSAHTLAALEEFYNETRTRTEQEPGSTDVFAVGAVAEDWVSHSSLRSDNKNSLFLTN